MRVCDNCKRDPEEFEIVDCDEKGWFFLVPEEDLDPVYLMSDLGFAWCAITHRDPPNDPGNQFWCVKCIDAIRPSEEVSDAGN